MNEQLYRGVRARIIEYLKVHGKSKCWQIREGLEIDDATHFRLNLNAACHCGVVKSTPGINGNDYDVGKVKTRFWRRNNKPQAHKTETYIPVITPPPYLQQIARERMNQGSAIGSRL